jgi:phosphate:Na+ symporter
MKIMTDLMLPMRSYGPFLEVMKNAENPFFGILAGMAFTMLVHSSGATSGIVIALALAGAINLEQAIPLNLGAQIGTCVTAALGSIGRGREGKRVALWHVFHQTSGVILVLPFLVLLHYNNESAWIYFVKWFTKTIFYSTDPARQIAMAHTLASLFNVLVFFPFLPYLNRLLCKIYPQIEEDKPFGPAYIDEGFINTPSLALEQARKEVAREGGIALEMMNESVRVLDSRSLKLSETVSLMDVRVDALRNAIVQYLTKLAQNSVLSEEQSEKEIRLLYISDDFESIGDIIDKNIMPLARKKLENKLWFSDAGWQEIVDLHSRVSEHLRRVIKALEDNDLETAKLISGAKVEIDAYEAELRKRHISRINSGLQESLETSSVHLDLIEQFKRINSLLTSAANTMLGKM